MCSVLEEDICSALEPLNFARNPLIEPWQGCTSSLGLAYIRNVGKVGGTTVRNNWLIPYFCRAFCPHLYENGVPISPRVKPWHGPEIPRACAACLGAKLRCRPSFTRSLGRQAPELAHAKGWLRAIASSAVTVIIARNPFGPPPTLERSVALTHRACNRPLRCYRASGEQLQVRPR